MNLYRVNAYIMSLFFFQFGLLQPFSLIVSSQVPVVAFTLMLLTVLVLNNKFRLKKRIVVSFILLNLFFLLNIITFDTKQEISVWLEFLIKGSSALLFGSIETDNKYLYKAFCTSGILNFIVLSFCIFAPFPRIAPMRFGYAMVPSVLVFIYMTIESDGIRKLLYILGLVASFLLMFIFGTRGALLVLMIFGFIVFCSSPIVSRPIKIMITVVSFVISLLEMQYSIFIKLLDFMYFRLNIQTYSLKKFRSIFVLGLVQASSGRNIIYNYLATKISESPLLGHGVGIVQSDIGFTAHNIFIQILVETGILGLLIWIGVWFVCYKKYRSFLRIHDKEGLKIATLIIAVAFGRLLVSSDMWLRPEYWFMISYLITYRVKKA